MASAINSNGGAPVLVLNTIAERESGRKAQKSNIEVAKSVSNLIRTCLGPQAMMKMLLDPMNGITCTADGHAILREIDMAHPAAKTLLDLCRTQDEEVGDGTTSVIIIAGEILAQTGSLLEKNFHPISIINAYRKGLQEAIKTVSSLSQSIDIKSDQEMIELIKGCLGTKIGARWSEMLCQIALRAVNIVAKVNETHNEVDIKRYVRIEKIPGGSIEDSRLVNGVVINKDVLHSNMRRRIENPRILLIDCSLEYKKGESMTNIEIVKEGDWNAFLALEEQQIKEMCDKIISHKPDIVICEKGVSDLAQHYLLKANITVFRRLKKTDNNRIARACGATIVNQVDEIREADIGTKCGLFHIELITNDYFAFFDECREPKACSVILRGPSKDIVNEIERNLHDCMFVVRNLFLNPSLVPGGGVLETEIAINLEKIATITENAVEKYSFNALSRAFEIIPRTLIQNSGSDATSLMIDLHAKHQIGGSYWGIDGIEGKLVEMQPGCGIWESTSVKLQTVKSAIEAACMILRVDDILSGLTRKENHSASNDATVEDENNE